MKLKNSQYVHLRPSTEAGVRGKDREKGGGTDPFRWAKQREKKLENETDQIPQVIL